jgi:thiopurine S-methyltransferase
MTLMSHGNRSPHGRSKALPGSVRKARRGDYHVPFALWQRSMDAQFWLDRWQRREIGFHQAEINPLLARHWHTLGCPPGSRVLVPLAGKSLDMTWLAAQDLRVLGVELSTQACAEYFSDQGVTPRVDDQVRFIRYHAGAVTLLAGDVFDLNADDLNDVAAIYDRGALVALPPDMRERYVATVYGHVPPGTRALLIALDYPQDHMAGPPFAINQDTVQALFGPRWRCTPLEQRDILAQEPRFRQAGLPWLRSTAWLLQCCADE